MCKTRRFAFVLVACLAAATGSSGVLECPCIQASSLQKLRESICLPETSALDCAGSFEAVRFPRQSGTFCYPADYGLNHCAAWNEGLEPDCHTEGAPGWCAQHWCYVAENCSLAK